jgi:hypothetical protein
MVSANCLSKWLEAPFFVCERSCDPGERNSGAKSLGSPGAGFGGFLIAILGRGGGLERLEELERDARDLLDGGGEGGFVGFGGLVEAGDFSDELKRSGADFVGSDGWIEIIESFDVAAHRVLLRRIKASVY